MIDWDDAFDNTGYVTGALDLAALWAVEAQAFREALSSEGRAELDLPYGAGEGEKLDLFMPRRAPKGVVIFIHGGYWHLFDKSYWSHLARGALENGWAVAIPSYPLAPEARISVITAAIARAVEFMAAKLPGPIRLAGHSAGGHLVARMGCAGVLLPETAARLERIVSISGVHELLPLTATKMNDTLCLTPDEARAESPALQKPVKAVPMSFWVGADERPEFLRQNRVIAETWGEQGVAVRTTYEPGMNHFTVIGSLADPDGALTREVLR